MQKLKESADKQSLEQKGADLGVYLDSLYGEMEHYEYWHTRAKNLELITLILYFGLVITLAFIDISPFAGYTIQQIMWMMWCLTMMRSSLFLTRKIGALREFNGAIKTLEILGLIPPRTPPRRKIRNKSWSPFARYQEFWERITQASKEQYT